MHGRQAIFLFSSRLTTFGLELFSGGLLLDAQLLADVGGDGVLVDGVVHRVGGNEGLGHVPDALVVAALAPRVLNHVVLATVLVLGCAEDQHAVVVGQFPVVEALLAHLLCGHDFGHGAAQRVDDVALLGGLHLQPFSHVAALQALRLLVVHGIGQSLAAEARLRNVTAPGHGVALLDGVVDDAHHLVHRQVVAERVAPVVLYLNGEGGVEGMVGVAGDANVVVPVKSERGCKALRCVALALVGELFGALAEVGVENTLQADLPLRRQLAGGALGDGSHVGLEQREELVEVVQRVAVKRTGEGHGVLGADAVVHQHVEDIVSRTALCKLAVAMQAYHLDGTVHVGLVGYERFAEVVGLARLL